MAGGKLSPRQKMINLMYLVFIAMLAIQMDKKVLSSFGFMKEKVETADGSITFFSEEGGGFHTSLSLPVKISNQS